MSKTNKKNKRDITQLERCNSFAMITHLILAVVMSIAYIAEVFIGNRTWGYSLIVSALALLPPIIEMYLFFMVNRESKLIKHVLGYGFGLLYSVVIFTAQQQLVFTYVIPMILIISVYNDLKYKLKINIAMILENVVVVFLGMKTGGFGYTNMAAAEIQLFIMVILGIYSIGMTQILTANEAQKLRLIEDEKVK